MRMLNLMNIKGIVLSKTPSGGHVIPKDLQDTEPPKFAFPRGGNLTSLWVSINSVPEDVWLCFNGILRTPCPVGFMPTHSHFTQVCF